MSKKRNRTVGSIKNELLDKSKEAALCAVQIFNNPNVTFKAESFIVLMMIAWTYLLHAYYRDNGIEYRYHESKGKRKKFQKIGGRHRYWDLSKCLNTNECPIDKITKKNLELLIGLRHEIEHSMTRGIDDAIGAKLQACCLNYNQYINKLFQTDISRHQPIALQFFSFEEEQIKSLVGKDGLPKNIIDFISTHEAGMTDEEKNSAHYRYKVIYVRDNASNEGAADKVSRFIPEGSAEGKEIHNVLLKNKPRPTLTHGDLKSRWKLNGSQTTRLVDILKAKNNKDYSEKIIAGKKLPCGITPKPAWRLVMIG